MSLTQDEDTQVLHTCTQMVSASDDGHEEPPSSKLLQCMHIPGSPAWKAEESPVVFQPAKTVQVLGMTKLAEELPVEFYQLGLEL